MARTPSPLTTIKIKEIVKKHQQGWKMTELSQFYKIDISRISRIIADWKNS